MGLIKRLSKQVLTPNDGVISRIEILMRRGEMPLPLDVSKFNGWNTIMAQKLWEWLPATRRTLHDKDDLCRL